ncbi:MAG: sigma-54-dependent Fis family transcriptional regulator [Planctomycetes bacterium]|nr:sigma-54-dependent Fis family transcriptional regulator [Planctomycetota bacterium]
MSQAKILVLRGRGAPAALPVGDRLELGCDGEAGSSSPALSIRLDARGTYLLRRIDATTAVELNGRAVEEAPLSRGDLISCGESVLLFDRPDEASDRYASTVLYRGTEREGGTPADVSRDRVRAILVLARVALGAPDEEALWEGLLPALRRALGADRASVHDGRSLDLVFVDPLVSAGTAPPLPASEVQAFAAEGAPILASVSRSGESGGERWVAAAATDPRGRFLVLVERARRELDAGDLLLVTASALLAGLALGRIENRAGRSAAVTELERTSTALARLQEITAALVRERNWDGLLDRVLAAALELSGAERGFLVIGRGAEERVLGKTLDGDSIPDAAARVSRGVLEEAIQSRRRVLVADAATAKPYSDRESITTRHLRSILCLPLLAGDETLGCLYLDHRHHEGVFAGPGLSVLASLADHAAAAIATARRVAEIERLNRELSRDNRVLSRSLEEARAWTPGGDARHRIVGSSPLLADLREKIRRAAETDLPVLVTGESGAGKELVARALHAQGPRRDGPFIAENAAALSGSLLEAEIFGHEKGAFTGADESRPGLFEAAHGGILFLDEVGELPAPAQAKLLRVLEEKAVRRVGGTRETAVDVRVVAATNRDLEAMVREGRFREDLFYRLGVVVLRMPSLRERMEDLPELAEHFLREFAVREGTPLKRLAPEALAELLARRWDGNVRELRNVLEAAALLAEGVSIRREDIPSPAALGTAPGVEDLGTALPFSTYKDALARRYFEQLLARHAGNITQAASAAGMSRQNLQRYLRELGLR